MSSTFCWELEAALQRCSADDRGLLISTNLPTLVNKHNRSILHSVKKRHGCSEDLKVKLAVSPIYQPPWLNRIHIRVFHVKLVWLDVEK